MMFAGSNTGAAFNALFLVNFYAFGSGDCFHGAGFNATDAGLTASTALAFAVFPAAFFIINFYWHDIN